MIEVTSIHNQYFKCVLSLLAGKRSDYLLLSSFRLIKESCDYYQPKIVIATDISTFKIVPTESIHILVTKSLFNAFQIGHRSVNIIALYQLSPAQKQLLAARQNNQLILILDKIQNPDNLGAILRTAYAYGVTNVIFTPDSCRPFSPKTVAAASLPNIYSFSFIFWTPTEIKEYCLKQHYSIVAAVPVSFVTKLTSWTRIDSRTQKTAILIGSEGSGISAEMINCATHKYSIVTRKKIHSLNAAVAFSILIDRLLSH